MTEKMILAVEKSTNSKTGVVSATYAPIHSCPGTCPFMDSGCYGQTSFCGMHLKKLNKAAEASGKTTPKAIALEEAAAIKKLKGDKPLRLHVVGDCKTSEAAEIVAKACDEYTNQSGEPVWTYTHAWKIIPREKWGGISVLASCESVDGAKEAIAEGYAASMIYPEQFDKPFEKDGMKMIPCPEMVRGVQCNKCKLCFNDSKLLDKKRVICFFPHSSGAKKVKAKVSKWTQ